MALDNQTNEKRYAITMNFYNLFSIGDKNLNINSDNLNVGGIFLCVCNELLGSKVKDADDLQDKIAQSNTLEFVKKSLFFRLNEARKSKRGAGAVEDTFEKVIGYDDEDIYEDKAGNQADLSALKTMESHLVESICDYADTWDINIFNLESGDTGLDRVIKKLMPTYPNSIDITNYAVIDADIDNNSEASPNFAVDVTVSLHGSEWVVQTWDGVISADCQTTVDGNYIELSTPAFSERLIDAVHVTCCHVAQTAIDKDISSELMLREDIATQAKLMFELLPTLEGATAATYAIMADKLSKLTPTSDDEAIKELRFSYQCSDDISRKILSAVAA